MAEIIANPIEWCNPMPNAWSANFFGETLQILYARDGSFSVIIPGSMGGGGIGTDAINLEAKLFDSLADAKKEVQTFMDMMVNTIAMIKPEGEVSDNAC